MKALLDEGAAMEAEGCRTVLCCAVLCCAVLCCAVLCWGAEASETSAAVCRGEGFHGCLNLPHLFTLCQAALGRAALPGAPPCFGDGLPRPAS
jgi:hypothetical protein